MSVGLINHAFKSKLPTVQKFVLIALCDHADNAGQCFPSVTRLAEKCSISQRHVFNCLKELEQSGFIVRKPRAGRGTVYHIVNPAAWPGAPGSPLNLLHPTPEPGSPCLLIEVLTTNEPPIEPPGNRQKRARGEKADNAQEQKRAIESYTAKTELRRALLDFKAMRQQMRKPMTGRALQLLLKKLDAMSNGDDGLKIQLLEQSVLKAWQDIYPLKNGGQAPCIMPCN